MVKHRDFKDGIHLAQQDQQPFQQIKVENISPNIQGSL
jgi:hypothetical protein